MGKEEMGADAVDKLLIGKGGQFLRKGKKDDEIEATLLQEGELVFWSGQAFEGDLGGQDSLGMVGKSQKSGKWGLLLESFDQVAVALVDPVKGADGECDLALRSGDVI
jgi:hypothetical protein